MPQIKETPVRPKIKKILSLFAAAVFLILLTCNLAAAAPSWLQLSPTPDPLNGSPAARYANTTVYNTSTNRMIIFAGSTASGCYGIVNDVWVLTNADGTGEPPAWIKLTPVGGPGPRYNHIAVYDQATNRMIVHAGHTTPGSCGGVVGDTWVLTNADGTGGTPEWIPLPTGPIVTGATAAYDPKNNRLIVWGGVQSSACGGNTDVTWVLTNANGLGGPGQWTQLSPANSVTESYFYNGPVGYDPSTNSLIGLACAKNIPNDSFNTIRLLTSANGLGASPAWTDLNFNGVMPSRSYSRGAYDAARNSMVITFGLDQPSRQGTSETWRLDHANGQGGTPSWTQLNPSGALPPGRYINTVVYNPTSDRIIIFGGLTGGVNGDTIIYNDVWVLTEAMGSPLPGINDQGVVVWTGFDGARYQICRWDPKTQTAVGISQSNYNNMWPQINAKGLVVWHGADGQVYRWDPKTKLAENISKNSYDCDNPQINAQGLVVWLGWDGAHTQIYRWDPKAQTALNISQSNHDNHDTQISAKGQVVWRGYDGALWQIYLWDPKTQTAINISQSNHDNYDPQISAKGLVVWRGYDGALWQIYLWDPKTQTATNISQSNHDNYDPHINAKGLVVWWGYDGARYQIYRWDPKTQTAVNFSKSNYDNYYPQINAKGLVVWRGYDGAHYQIYRWDPKTQTAANLSQDIRNTYFPQINAKGLVVWERDDGSGIYSVRLYNPKTGQATKISP
jgi:hypothetical protein